MAHALSRLSEVQDKVEMLHQEQVMAAGCWASRVFDAAAASCSSPARICSFLLRP